MAAKYAPKEPPSFPFKRQLERLGEAIRPLIIPISLSPPLWETTE